MLFGISDLGFQARFQHLRPRFQLVADPIDNYANQIIEQVTEEKDLGVIIDNQMKFHQHVSLATSKVMRMVGVSYSYVYFGKYFVPIPIDTLYNTVINTLVRPHLEYGNVIWEPFYTLVLELRMYREQLYNRLFPSINHLTKSS